MSEFNQCNMAWPCCAFLSYRSQLQGMHMQDGNGYILIDVPDENFTDAYSMLPHLGLLH